MPNYAVVQHNDDYQSSSDGERSSQDVEVEKEKNLAQMEVRPVRPHKELLAEAQGRLHAKLRKKKGPMGWAMRTLQ